MARVNLLVVLVILATLILGGCGGSGGQTTPIEPDTTVVIEVPAGQAVNATVAEATVAVPAGAFAVDTTVTVQRWRPDQFRLPNRHSRIGSSGFRIRSTSQPSTDLELRLPKPADPGTTLAVHQTEDGWATLDATTAHDTVTVKIAPNTYELVRSQRPGALGLIALAIFPPPPSLDRTASLERLAGRAEFAAVGGRTALIVHGFSDSHEDFALLAAGLLTSGRYGAVYALKYDFRLPGESAAELLRTQLTPYRGRGKVVDIYAHSWGGLVTRHCLETLGETHVIDNVYFVCSPHRGTAIADLGRLVNALVNFTLNVPGTGEYRGLLGLGTPSIQDLASTGRFVRELNQANGQRGHVNYHLVSAGLDLVVDGDSAHARGVQLEEMTNGTVTRHTDLAAGHNSLVKSPAGIERLLEFVAEHRSDRSVEMVLEPNPVEARSDGWFWTIRIRNHGPTAVRLLTLTFDSFNRNGTWLGATWYDPDSPPGRFFPPEYRRWGLFLDPGQEARLYIRDVPDRNRYTGLTIEEVPVEMRARSLEHTLVYERLGQQTTTVSRLTEYYQDLWPADPNVRSPRAPGQGNGVGQIRSPVVGRINQ